jgi:hypothetical protein
MDIGSMTWNQFDMNQCVTRVHSDNGLSPCQTRDPLLDLWRLLTTGARNETHQYT